jgi:DamX protein
MSEPINGFDMENKAQNYHLFKPASWKLKIDFIHRLIVHNNLLMLILAENAGGKTSFASLLNDSFAAQTKVLYLNANELANEASLNFEISNYLNMSSDQNLSSTVQRINQIKQSFVLIVDDAHKLSDDMLNCLIKLINEQDENASFNICLLADYSIVASISEIQNHYPERVVHSFELGHLKEKECKTYLQHLVNLSGQEHKQLKDELVHQIYKLTAGDMAKINSHYQSFMAASSDVKQDKMPSKKQLFAELGIAVFAVTFVLSYYFKNLAPGAEEVASKAHYVQAEQTPPVLKSQIASLSKTPVLEQQQRKKKEEKIVLNSYIPKIMMPQHPVQLSSLLAPFPGFPKQALVKKPVVHHKSVAHKAKPVYTIQLIAVHDKNNINTIAALLKQYDKKHKLQMNKNKRLYTLSYGQYPTFKEAKAELNKLPAVMKEHKPWIRKLDSMG